MYKPPVTVKELMKLEHYFDYSKSLYWKMRTWWRTWLVDIDTDTDFVIQCRPCMVYERQKWNVNGILQPDLEVGTVDRYKKDL